MIINQVEIFVCFKMVFNMSNFEEEKNKENMLKTFIFMFYLWK